MHPIGKTGYIQLAMTLKLNDLEGGGNNPR